MNRIEENKNIRRKMKNIILHKSVGMTRGRCIVKDMSTI